MSGARVGLGVVVVIVSGLVAGAARADEAGEWLPALVAEGAAEQLAGRLGEAGFGVEKPAERAEAARAVVAGLRDTLEAWGADGTLARAPEFPELAVPRAEDRRLDAMARWHVCNLVLFLQLADPALADDVDAKLTGALGLTGVTLAVLRLRQPFLAAGGDARAVEGLLAGPGMEPVLERLQNEAEARGHAETRCQAPVVELLARSVANLAALAEAHRQNP
ncbi:MAG TPA: hypothetical protein VLA66_14835 [Thermoanaerobaculia bacterium]|nr:hypothetical protein [Thermoanaerobaculia bacterium]